MQKDEKSAKPDIHSYHDYRQYLADLFAHLKSQRKGFSVSKLSIEAEIAAGYLPMVISGSMKLSEKALAKISPLLGFSSGDQQYLRLLCKIADSDSEKERIDAVNKLQKARGYQKLNPKETEVFRYLSNWYCVAIREMATLPDFKEDPAWIQKRLWHPISQNEITRSLEFLTVHGFLEREPSGKIKAPTKRLECLDRIYNLAIVQYHRQVLMLASESLTHLPGSKRNIMGFTIAISEKRFEEVRALLDKAMGEVVKFAEGEETPDCVYQISLLGFPLVLPIGATE
jgi:uncharacterized protein (TIGR02147 family)